MLDVEPWLDCWVPEKVTLLLKLPLQEVCAEVAALARALELLLARGAQYPSEQVSPGGQSELLLQAGAHSPAFGLAPLAHRLEHPWFNPAHMITAGNTFFTQEPNAYHFIGTVLSRHGFVQLLLHGR